MAKKIEIEFISTDEMICMLRAALEIEMDATNRVETGRDEKDEKFEAAQYWARMVYGYNMIEQGLKGLLHIEGNTDEAEKAGHQLHQAYSNLSGKTQKALETQYEDYIEMTMQTWDGEPLESLDDFLKELDGDGRGSFNWRYLLTQKPKGKTARKVHPTMMHEVIIGIIHAMHCSIEEGDMSAQNFSKRQQRRALNLYNIHSVRELKKRAEKKLKKKFKIAKRERRHEGTGFAIIEEGTEAPAIVLEYHEGIKSWCWRMHSGTFRELIYTSEVDPV